MGKKVLRRAGKKFCQSKAKPDHLGARRANLVCRDRGSINRALASWTIRPRSSTRSGRFIRKGKRCRSAAAHGTLACALSTWSYIRMEAAGMLCVGAGLQYRRRLDRTITMAQSDLHSLCWRTIVPAPRVEIAIVGPWRPHGRGILEGHSQQNSPVCY